MKSLIIILALCTMHVEAQHLIIQADSIRTWHHIPEMGYAVLTADKVLAMQVMGHHQVNQVGPQDTAMLATDHFHLGSNTKAITGFVAAYLVEHHKINWHTRFFDLLPEWRTQSDSAYYSITLQDLLSHQARIQSFTSGLEFKLVPDLKGSTAERRRQFAAYVLKQKPVSIPAGSNYSYSNAGYSIAVQMLEKVSGLSWEQLVDNILNKQLGLHVKFGWPNRTDIHQPWGHWEEAGKQEALPPTTTYNLQYIEPAGDISMTLPDYVRLAQLHMQGLVGKPNLLKPETYRFMHYGIDDYAIGWGNHNKEGKKISFHAGSAGTFYCYCLYDNETNKAYIICTNSGTQEATKGASALLALLIKSY